MTQSVQSKYYISAGGLDIVMYFKWTRIGPKVWEGWGQILASVTSF